jgi:hypothetical protein
LAPAINTTSDVGEDPQHHMGAALDLLVEAFQHVCRFQMLMVLARQPAEAQRLVDASRTRGKSLNFLASPTGFEPVLPP